MFLLLIPVSIALVYYLGSRAQGHALTFPPLFVVFWFLLNRRSWLVVTSDRVLFSAGLEVLSEIRSIPLADVEAVELAQSPYICSLNVVAREGVGAGLIGTRDGEAVLHQIKDLLSPGSLETRRTVVPGKIFLAKWFLLVLAMVILVAGMFVLLGHSWTLITGSGSCVSIGCVGAILAMMPVFLIGLFLGLLLSFSVGLMVLSWVLTGEELCQVVAPHYSPAGEALSAENSNFATRTWLRYLSWLCGTKMIDRERKEAKGISPEA